MYYVTYGYKTVLNMLDNRTVGHTMQ